MNVVKIDPRFKNRMAGVFEKYRVEVGVLQDKPHMKPKRWKTGDTSAHTMFAGGPVRKLTKVPSGKTVAEVSKLNRERLGFNYLAQPFKKVTDPAVKTFIRSFFDYAFGRTQKRRLENSLQAAVRNPILRGEYGSQGGLGTLIKGFDRPMIDTGQLFKNITARVRRREGVS